MILLQGRFIYLATPATASRSTASVLVEQGGKFLAGTHHANLPDMPTLKEYSEPVYSLLRDPYDYVLAQYYYQNPEPEKQALTSLETFVPKYGAENRDSPFGSIMAMYRDYVDMYFIYEDGIKAFFDAVGLPDVTIPELGRRVSRMRGPRQPISPTVKELIEMHFAKEIELYKNVSDSA